MEVACTALLASALKSRDRKSETQMIRDLWSDEVRKLQSAQVTGHQQEQTNKQPTSHGTASHSQCSCKVHTPGPQLEKTKGPSTTGTWCLLLQAVMFSLVSPSPFFPSSSPIPSPPPFSVSFHLKTPDHSPEKEPRAPALIVYLAHTRVSKSQSVTALSSQPWRQLTGSE
ncbi:hypothetical protein ElyMa_000595800 [Elysia marginata]|uniref:Uncharacterized protein n=1 Tax=Elysia marginata TaxID=1093978 RepID=A0AAV4G956_9GAST|nr:hypothetical protein ElyMa_000595800 [Elysia marginata]